MRYRDTYEFYQDYRERIRGAAHKELYEKLESMERTLGVSLKNKMESLNKIIDTYLLCSDDFVDDNFAETFDRIRNMLLIEMVLSEFHMAEEQDFDRLFDIKDTSRQFQNSYKRIRGRIREDLSCLEKDDNKEWEYEPEVLVITFRLLKFFYLDGEKLYLKLQNNKNRDLRVRIYNDYKVNVYYCKNEGGINNYEKYKIVSNCFEKLKGEVEYLNDFVLNCYAGDFRNIFRITKVVYDTEDFLRDFVQGEVGFRASFGIIQKLIGPLYLNKESYGIREMLQNAVDACRKSKTRSGKKIIVRCFRENERVRIRIEDNGCGMDEDTIVDKFLTVGESGKDGENAIGKFGIGILSAFLLSDAISFTTVSENNGLLYKSDEINLEKVQSENTYINISIRKPDKEAYGTKIELELKESIINSDAVKLKKEQTGRDLRNNMEELLALKLPWGSLWYGYTAERKEFNTLESYEGCKNVYLELCKGWDREADIEEALKACMTQLGSLKQETARLTDMDPNLRERVYTKIQQVLENLEAIEYIDEIAILRYLEADQWYLLREQEEDLKIEFIVGKNHILNYYTNITLKEIETGQLHNVRLDGQAPVIEYFWTSGKAYRGHVFCNGMRIPSEYQYECSLHQALLQKPVILVTEGIDSRIEIDLAREKCELSVNGRSLEQDILESIILGDLEQESGKHIREISWLYYKENGAVKRVRKCKYTLEAFGKNGWSYFLVFVCPREMERKEDTDSLMKFGVENMKSNTVYEFIHTEWILTSSFDTIENSDLYIAADFKLDIYVNKAAFDRIRDFDITHLRALALAANNIYGYVDVSVKNQLKLGNESLARFKNENVYQKQIDMAQARQGMYRLNYGSKKEERTLSVKSENICGMIEINLLSPYSGILKSLSRPYSRRIIWNEFQTGIFETELKSQGKLYQFLTKEEDIKWNPARKF